MAVTMRARLCEALRHASPHSPSGMLCGKQPGAHDELAEVGCSAVSGAPMVDGTVR